MTPSNRLLKIFNGKASQIQLYTRFKKDGLITAALYEAEAIYNACRDNNIKVIAFCDSERRRTEQPYCGLEVIHSPTLPVFQSSFYNSYTTYTRCGGSIGDFDIANFTLLELLEK